MQENYLSNKNGQLLQQDFPDNTGGTNLADSVFKILPNQAADGYNFDYILTGGLRKRLGPAKINSVADTQLSSMGFGQYAPTSGTSKSVFRAAGTQLQLVDTSASVFTALSSDTATPSTDPFNSAVFTDVQFSQFSNGVNDILWAAGGGATLPVGAYSLTNYTTNGVQLPTGVVAATVNSHAGGSWTATGDYYYTIVYRKRSTQAFSNASLDVLATIANTDDSVTLSLVGLTSLDTTLIDKVFIYRSSRSGVSGFTTGNLIAELDSTVTSFIDLGDLGTTTILSSQNIPRVANTVLDNSPLPAATYNTLTLWGHRLATSSGNNLYITDVNKSESWPLTNYITVPSAGPITGLATISFTSPQANSLQELLVIFKERELWVLTGSNYTNWTLLKVDNTGCPQQSLVVSAQGFLAWIDYRGVHLWDGTSKPIYCSRLIEPLFGTNGDLDKSNLGEGVGAFFRRENEIIWFLSSKTYGAQKFAIKMDVRLTLLQIEQNLTGRTIDAVFIPDVYSFPIYAALSYVPLNASNEQMIIGDNAGFCYFASNGNSDGGADYAFQYKTAPLHMGDPNSNKNFLKVIAWVQNIGTWNLELDYWTNYKAGPAYQTTQTLPLTTENVQGAAVWDIAFWDVAFWDSYTPDIVPVIFNLQAGTNNTTQGTAIQLQFRNDKANQPIIIHGFSVIYSILGGIQ